MVESLRNVLPVPEHAGTSPRAIRVAAPERIGPTLVLPPGVDIGNTLVASFRTTCAAALRASHDRRPRRRDDAASAG